MKKLYEYSVEEIVKHCIGMQLGENHTICEYRRDCFGPAESGRNQIPVRHTPTGSYNRWGDGVKDLQSAIRGAPTEDIEVIEIHLDKIFNLKYIGPIPSRLELILNEKY